MSVISIDRSRPRVVETLALSESRTYDCALEILGAYKLTGNFLVDLEIVLKELGVLGQVSFEVKPKKFLSDCRHVAFAPRSISTDRFHEVVRCIANRIGFQAAHERRLKLFG